MVGAAYLRVEDELVCRKTTGSRPPGRPWLGASPSATFPSPTPHNLVQLWDARRGDPARSSSGDKMAWTERSRGGQWGHRSCRTRKANREP